MDIKIYRQRKKLKDKKINIDRIRAGDKNISKLYLSCMTSDLQFSLVLQTMHLYFKSVCNKEHKGVTCDRTSSKLLFPKHLSYRMSALGGITRPF